MDMRYYVAFAAYPSPCKKFQEEWNDVGMDWRSWKDVQAHSALLQKEVKVAADEHEKAMDEYFVVMREADNICGEVPFCMT